MQDRGDQTLEGTVGCAGEFERTDLDPQQWGHCKEESMQAG